MHRPTPLLRRTSAWSRCRPATPSHSSTTRSRGGWRGGWRVGTPRGPSTPSRCTSPSTKGSAATTGGARCCSAPAGSGSSWPRRTTSETDDGWIGKHDDHAQNSLSQSAINTCMYDVSSHKAGSCQKLGRLKRWKSRYKCSGIRSTPINQATIYPIIPVGQPAPNSP